MRDPIRHAAWKVCAGWLLAAAAQAQSLNMQWGLQNEWAYREEHPARTADATAKAAPGAAPVRRDRTFAFNEGKTDVREPWLACVNAVMELWGPFVGSPVGQAQPPGSEASRLAFQAHVRRQNPACVAQFRKTAPQLYFDFVADNAAQWVLEEIAVTTLDFAEYRGGGFAESEAGYDLLLSHRKGIKVYRPEPRLRFTGSGRALLRLWSDNFYPNVGWIAPMGEYTIDIAFVFSVTGRRVTVRTGPFKIEV